MSLDDLAARTYDAVLFDLDGTLIDSTPAVDRCWRQWAHRRGIKDFEVVHGVPAKQVVAALVPPAEVEAAVAEIEALEVLDTDGVVQLPGAARALADIPAARRAIATSGTMPLARARLTAAGLQEPAVLVTASDVAVGKPDPEPYRMAAARLGFDPARCLVVEDAPAGVTAGRAAGCAVLAVATSHPAAQLAGADALVQDLSRVRFRVSEGVLVLDPQPVAEPAGPSGPAEPDGDEDGPQFRSDVTVELVRASAADADVLFAARVSTQGETSLEQVGADPTRSRGLLNYLMRDRHGSPFEHNSMTFYVQAPIFVFREFMRHRIASYNEESGRYRELRPVFYVPGPERMLRQEGKPGHYEFVPGSSEQHELVGEATRQVCRHAYRAYRQMLAAGVAREVARIVLPVTIYSSMYVTLNARSLMNFLSLRTRRPDARFPSFPQREIEMCAERMEQEWAALMPLTHAAFEANGRVAP